jgi:hypothetical protein
MINPRGWIVVALVALTLACLSFGNAGAHDFPADWIGQERRTNAANMLCCGAGDCKPYRMSEIKVTPEGYVLPNGDLIPFNVAAPSVDEFFWSCEWGGSRKCTFAPIGGT